MTFNSLVIGSGSIGERHAKNLVKSFNQNVYVLTRNPNKKFRDPFLNSSNKVSRISHEEIGGINSFESVIIATPSSIRSDAINSINNSKIGFIYAEVPAAISFSEWVLLKEKAALLGAELYAGYNMRFHPGYQKINLLNKSNFVSFRGIFAEYLPALHTWEDYKNRYEAKTSLGGGPLLTSHHELDISMSLFGPVKSVSCHMRNSLLDIEAYDHALINLFHDSGAVSNLDLNFFYKEYTRRIEISTSEELIIYEPFSSGLKIGEEQICFKDFDFNKTYINCLGNAFNKGISNFSISIEEVDHLLKITDACFLSSSLGGIITDIN